MGVDYFLVCQKHKESMYLGKIWRLEEVVKKIIKKETVKIEIPDLVKPLIDEYDLKIIEDVQRFRERHKNCKIILANDHMEYPEEWDYYPEVDWDRPIDRTEEFLHNLKFKAPMIVWTIEGAETLSEEVKKKYELMLTNVLPYGWDKPKLKREIPIKRVVARFRDDIPGLPEYYCKDTVYETVDGRLFIAYGDGSGRFITKKEYEEMKKFYGGSK